MPIGKFPWIFDTRADYATADADLAPYLPVHGQVSIAAVDSGLFISPTDHHISGHLPGPDDYEQDLAAKNATVIARYHGTSAAALAVYGSPGIHILSIRASFSYMVDPKVAPANIWGAGVDWAVKKGAKIVYANFEWDDKHTHDFQTMLAKHKDVLFVVNTGNFGRQIGDGRWTRTAKGKPDNLLMVGGCTRNGDVPDAEAGWGFHPDTVDVGIFADDTWNLYNPPEFSHKIQTDWTPDQHTPRCWKGVGVQYTFNAGDLIVGKGGVSFGTPVVANIAAKMLLIHPALTAAQLRTLLMSSATQAPGLAGKNVAGGYIDAAKAYKAAHDAK